MLEIEINANIDENGNIDVSINNSIERKRTQRVYKGNSVIDIIKNYIVIDIETTGLDSNFNEIIEISALKVRDNKVVDKYTSLVKPRAYFYADVESTDFYIENNEKIQYIDEFISSLTGITNKMLGEANDITNVLPSFNEFIKDDILIGHNINFDINFLYDNYMTYLNKPLTNDFIDTLRMSRKLLPELKHHRLDDLIDYFNKETRNEHRALNDCVLTNEIYNDLSILALKKYETIENFKILFKKKHTSSEIKAKNIVAQTNTFDKEHPLYGKVCVFTGTLEKMLRKEAMQIVVNLGGTCGDNVTSQTNYLILGNNDYCKSIKDGKSNKQKKAEKLKMSGQYIEIISENVFYDLIEEN